MINENIPQTNLNWKNYEIVGLFSSSSLLFTMSWVNISVLKGRPKRKLDRLGDFSVCVSSLYFIFLFILNKPGRTVICSLYSLTISNRTFCRKVYIFFEDRHNSKANDNLFATHNHNPIFNLLKRNCALRFRNRVNSGQHVSPCSPFLGLP